MKKTSLLFAAAIALSSTAMAGPLVNAVILDNNGRQDKSIANKAVKVNVAKKSIDKNDTAVQKVVKGKVIRGDYRVKRQLQHR